MVYWRSNMNLNYLIINFDCPVFHNECEVRLEPHEIKSSVLEYSGGKYTILITVVCPLCEEEHDIGVV